MVTKWMRNVVIVVWIALIAVAGIAQGLLWHWGERDYQYSWESGRTEHSTEDIFWRAGVDKQLNEWIQGQLRIKAVQEALTMKEVSAGEVELYRNQYGTLDEQVMSIRDRYDAQISTIKTEEGKRILEQEKQKLIVDIYRNFNDEAYVKRKIIAERTAEAKAFLPTLKKVEEERLAIPDAWDKVLVMDVHDKVTKERLYMNPLSKKDVLFEIAVNSPLLTAQLLPSGHTFEYELQGTVYVTKKSLANSAVLTKSFAKFNERLMWRQWMQYGSLTIFALAIVSYFAFIRRWSFSPQWLTKVFVEVRLILLVIGILTVPVITVDNTRNMLEWNYSSVVVKVMNVTIDWGRGAELFFILVVYGALLYALMNSLTNRKWSEQTTLRLTELFIFKSPVVIALFIMALTGVTGVCLGFMVAGMASDMSVIVGFMSGMMALMLFAYYMTYLNKVIRGALLAKQGRLTEDLPVRSRGRLGELAAAINELKNNVDISRGEQLKSERFKTELISNVSHDLRTPLTSIITYTDLLKQGDVTDEERSEYLDILDRKSQRLKTLIDDLFEVTKMSTGNVELQRKEGDIVQLLQQALGEHSEAFDAQGLQVRLTHSEKPINVLMDGDKMWRVFDNVLGNIVKYAQPQSRVYISLQATETNVVLQFKNMSHYELGDNVDELLERFKRGDTSRHTEGSGLGLAIVQTIVELHGGQFTLGVEGDLFKVTIELKR